ncbi:MAG TPA: D-glycerate dehydrogenase [Acidimicrobiaceae bacterium]|nr:D-glycerate dehydrogenase [Acidimicrobiaceae bacterium]
MPEPVVLVTRRLPDGALDPLIEAGIELEGGTEDLAWDRDALAGAVTEVDGLVCLLDDPVDATVLRHGAAGRLRVVANVAVGYDNIDVQAAGELGVVVCNTPGVLDDATADVALLLILAASRRASDAEAELRRGEFTGWGLTKYLGRDMSGAVLGLVGYGRIGRAVAARAAGFAMTVLHHRPTPTAEPGYVATLDELLERSDIVSLHVPLTEGTRHLIGRAELARMGPAAVLVNTSRGPVVDEEALAEALHAGTIFAAGLDVYEHEPSVHPSLLDAPHTVLLPHIGSATVATRRAMARLACIQVRDVLQGRPPAHPVTLPAR